MLVWPAGLAFCSSPCRALTTLSFGVAGTPWATGGQLSLAMALTSQGVATTLFFLFHLRPRRGMLVWPAGAGFLLLGDVQTWLAAAADGLPTGLVLASSRRSTWS